MKTLIFLLLLIALPSVSAPKLHNGLPVISAKETMADYRVENDWYIGQWSIKPSIDADTLTIPCYLPVEDFVFYTDQDSLQIDVQKNQTAKFYVALNDTTFALTMIQGKCPEFDLLRFDTLALVPNQKIIYEDHLNNSYLYELQHQYHLDRIIKGAANDTERVVAIMHWVHQQWKHDSSNKPQKSDAISILEEVRQGKKFRCVEYGIVTAACLNSIGLKARVLRLKTKEVETTQTGAGHVVTEVYLNDLHKWIMIDSQWDAMPIMNKTPLNAIEFQKAIANNYAQLNIQSLSGINKRSYVKWIYPYLFYFSCPIDNREGTNIVRQTVEGKKFLMLVPLGHKNPTIFQIHHPINNCLYTHSLKTFYAPPVSY